MKTNKESLQASMDRRLSFLDERPSCRAVLQYRIAQEEEPVMKKKISLGLVFAIVMVLLSVAALAAGLLLSPRVSASRAADQALEDKYGITAEMQTFFAREDRMLRNGTAEVTYTGAGCMEYVLGTYTAIVRDGKAEISWSGEGENTSGGYDAEHWGIDQLKQMMADSETEEGKLAFMEKAKQIAVAHGAWTEEETSEEEETEEPPEEQEPTEEELAFYAQREADKTAAMEARRLSEEDMIETGREFVINEYRLSEEQAARLELYTNSFEDAENTWYDMVDKKPCFLVEYLLYREYTTEQLENDEPRGREAKDGFYKVYINVETGAVEDYQYDSGLGGIG